MLSKSRVIDSFGYDMLFNFCGRRRACDVTINSQMAECFMGFAGKTAIVTGAAGGMGFAIAQALLADGANVTLVDIKGAEMDGAAATDGIARIATGSITDRDFVSSTIADTHEAFGRIDYLVNAAGVLWFDRDRSVADIDFDVWDDVLSINLKGAAHMVKACLPAMRAGDREAGRAMVHFSTIQALRGDARPQDAYQASKAGLIALSKSIAVQFAGEGIRSNCILPGPTRSPMQDRWRDDPAGETATARAVPLGRVGTVTDMADACLFLLSDKASWITGTELVVDGGLTALP